MSEQTMKILRMLEEGKITPDEANDLLSKVEALEEEAAKPVGEPKVGPQFRGGQHFEIPDFGQMNIPPIPDVHRIVSDALREAFKGFQHPPHPPASRHEQGDAPSYNNTNFAGAKMEYTDLTEAKLDDMTRLEGADLRYSSFIDADLRGADLRGANLSYSDFTDADLRNADLQGAQLHHGAYSDADFRGSNLQGADLSLSDLTNASFKNVKHPGLTLRGMQMVGIKYESIADADIDTRQEEATIQTDEPVSVTDTPSGKPMPTSAHEETSSVENGWDNAG